MISDLPEKLRGIADRASLPRSEQIVLEQAADELGRLRAASAAPETNLADEQSVAARADQGWIRTLEHEREMYREELEQLRAELQRLRPGAYTFNTRCSFPGCSLGPEHPHPFHEVIYSDGTPGPSVPVGAAAPVAADPIAREVRALAGVPDMDELVPIAELSRALDEIYALRTLLAYEAAVRAADLELRSYPKSRREIAEHAIQRMRGAARGEEWLPYITERARRSARAAAGMPDTLTRHSWRAERPDPTNPPEEGTR
jgi:hypothetical protein